MGELIRVINFYGQRHTIVQFAWRYRDYVIRAFNKDKPYDVFIREQIAGDELDEVSDESLTATALPDWMALATSRPPSGALLR